MAIKVKSREMIKTLHHKGLGRITPCPRDKMKQTILHSAVVNNAPHILKFIIENFKFDGDEQDCFNKTALDYAYEAHQQAEVKDTTMLDLLLRFNPKLHLNSNSFSLLHKATLSGQLHNVKSLLGRGFKVGERDGNGKSSLDHARDKAKALGSAEKRQQYQQIFDMLLSKYESQMDICGFCDKSPVHVQFEDCQHQVSCIDCCIRWQKCQFISNGIKCNQPIRAKIDLLMSFNGQPWRLSKVNPQENWQNDRLCPVCMSEPRNRVFNCGHTACSGCAMRIQTCFCCRQIITSRNIFFL